ncbi:hypothetical protein QFC19_005883 [Naganishia cerealis]|uniref:Uncharacterized protein n=1 Tax=Naganishia cerealis TaxID=610337 RepID=A0ACC2VKX7_9TREE|nr:hypothetical protein QFC19_005883 [Naganishia cerealis]
MSNIEAHSESFQRTEWKNLKASVDKIVEALTRNNIKESAIKLFNLNIYRGQGYIVRSFMKSQLTRDKQHTKVLASLAAVINSKFPEVGQILISRLVVLFRKSFVNNDKPNVTRSTHFLVHLMNQYVCSDIVILQILQLLLENPTNNSVRAATSIMTEGGHFLVQHAANASAMIFDRLRSFLQDPNSQLDGSVLHDIDLLLRERRHRFSRYPAVTPDLDLVEEEDRETHTLILDETIETHDELNSFKFDENWQEEENRYKEELREILGDSDEVAVAPVPKEEPEKTDKTIDMTNSDLINFQKTVYLTIMGSMSSDEAVHKLLKLSYKNNSDVSKDEVLADMVIKCGSEEKTYSKYIGIIGEKLCSKSRRWQVVFVRLFKQYYEKIHQFNTNAVRNIGKLFGHLFACGILPIEECWDTIEMTEDGTTSAGRIFIKFVFQELVEEVGIGELVEMVEAENVQSKIQGMFPTSPQDMRDAEHVRFSINYFTAIGLGRLTEQMRSALKRLELEPRGRKRERRGSESSDNIAAKRSMKDLLRTELTPREDTLR